LPLPVHVGLEYRLGANVGFRFASGIKQTSILLHKHVVAKWSLRAQHNKKYFIYLFGTISNIQYAPMCTPLRHRSVSRSLQRNGPKEARKHCHRWSGSTRSVEAESSLDWTGALDVKNSVLTSGSFLRSLSKLDVRLGLAQCATGQESSPR